MPFYPAPKSAYTIKNVPNQTKMMTKPNSKGTPGLLKAAPLALLLLFGNQLLAQTSSQPAAESGVTVLEILGYVGMIVAVILLAWIIGSAQSKNKPAEGPPRPHHHRHFDHPNDPHFRKLKKKTS
jgi:hypothetical protein